MRQFCFVVLSVILAGVSLGGVGCRPAASPEELGTVVFEVPQVPGSDAPYPMPQLDGDSETTPPAPGSPTPPVGEPAEGAQPPS